MKRRSARLGRTVRAIGSVALCLILLVAPGGVVPANASDLSDRISSAKQRQAELQRTIDRQKQLLDALTSEEDTARSALTSTRKQLDA